MDKINIWIGLGSATITVIIGGIINHLFTKDIKKSQVMNSDADSTLKTAQASASLIEQMETIVNNYKEIVKNTKEDLEIAKRRCDDLEKLIEENRQENEFLRFELKKLQDEFNSYKSKHN
jgi:predicted RNase H-like nuclease (RuvC/YqgF family)